MLRLRLATEVEHTDVFKCCFPAASAPFRRRLIPKDEELNSFSNEWRCNNVKKKACSLQEGHEHPFPLKTKSNQTNNPPASFPIAWKK